MRSACDVSGLIEMLLGRELRLDNRLMTSIALVSLISIGCGHLADSYTSPDGSNHEYFVK